MKKSENKKTLNDVESRINLSLRVDCDYLMNQKNDQNEGNIYRMRSKV